MSSSAVLQIKDRLDIVDIISSYIKLEKSGINWKARCPFHNEKTPSFFVSTERQTFYCFGCQAKGDIFSFVEQIEGLDFKSTLVKLAEKAGVDIKDTKNLKSDGEKEKMLEIMEKASEIYHNNLKSDRKALDYLKKRGISEESISKWKLGLSKNEWRSLYQELSKLGFLKEDLLLVGLLKKVEGEEKYYDTFRGRVMFPIKDTLGRIIAFSGRIIEDDGKSPKYINSPETKLFYKSEVLYGFDIAKKNIKKLDYAVLVEGQIDLVMSHQSGVENTVASSGTALTVMHLEKIKKITKKIIIAYDEDNAGQKASRKAAEIGLSLGMEVKIASLEENEDPASIIKKDPNLWKKSLRQSKHFLDFILEKTIYQNKGEKLTKEIINNILPLTNLIKSDIEKSQFIKKIAIKIGVPENSVISDLKKIEQPNILEEKNYKPDNEVLNIEKIIIGLVFLEEEQKDNTNKDKETIKEKWQLIEDNDINSMIEKYRFQKEKLIFEVENNLPKIKIEELLNRIELQNLRKKIQIKASLLDDKNITKEQEKTIKNEFINLEKRIKELNNQI